ncbi:MAG: amino acid ABC transporter permease [Eubacteriales bacterium]
MAEFIRVTQSLASGFVTTAQIFFLTLLLALPLGLIMSFGSMSKFLPVRWVMRIFVWIIRGTPLMLQLIAIFYVPGMIGKWATQASAALLASTGTGNALLNSLATLRVPPRFTAVIVAFVINYACYFSEIYRGGIESMPRGQYEAGAVLGMTKTQVFFKVILFQVIKKIIPPMGNEIITLVKDTSLARIISVYEIIWAAQKFAKVDGIVWPIFYTGAFYLIFCGLLTLLFGFIEKKMDYYKA